MSDIREIDAVAEGLDNLMIQYKETNVADIAEVFLNELQKLIDVNKEVYTLRWIDTATGVQLDLIGDLVGQKRNLLGITQAAYFGFEGVSLVESFGTLQDSSKGGRMVSVGGEITGDISLIDSDYRKVLKARIQRNYTDCTHSDIISSIRAIIDQPDVPIYINSNSVLYKFSPTSYAKSLSSKYLTDFDIGFLVTFSDPLNKDRILVSGDVIEGSHLNSLYVDGNDIKFTILDNAIETTFTWEAALDSEKVEYFIKLTRIDSTMTLTINGVEQAEPYNDISGEYSSTCTSTQWDINTVAGSFSSTFNDEISVQSLWVTKDNILSSWFFDNSSKYIPCLSTSEDSALYDLEIFNYSLDDYTIRDYDYVVYIYTTIRDTDKILLGELDLIPQPAGKSATYFDTLGVFT